MASDLFADAAGVSTVTAHEAAGWIGALPARIKLVDQALRLCEPAFSVNSPPGDNLFIHHAIYAAAPGDVLVVECANGDEYGYRGKLMSTAAGARGPSGLVITGGLRAADRLKAAGLPLFSGAVSIRGTARTRAARA